MKTKVLLISLLLCAVSSLFAQQTVVPILNFEERVHDFGQIKEEDGRVAAIFVFTNTADKPVSLTNVQASCGCTTPNWPKEPIAPGKKSFIKVTYNPAGRPGSFNKSITIRFLVAGEDQAKGSILNIKGVVVPRPRN